VAPTDEKSARLASVRRLRRTLWLLLTAVIVAVVAAAGVDLAIDRRAAIAQSVQRCEDTVRLLEEHFRRVERATEFILGRAAALTEGHSAQEMRGDELSGELAALEAGLPEKGRVLIADANGNWVINSRGYRTDNLSIADRAYFISHRIGATTVIGEMVSSKVGNLPMFTISRRISDAGGAFKGVAVAAIEAEYFTQLNQTLGLGDRGHTGVYRLDGGIILRQPDFDVYKGRSVAGGPLLRAVAEKPRGVLIGSRSPLDDIPRITAYRVLDDLGLVVMAGVPMDDALAEWRQSRNEIAVGVAVFVGLLLFLARLSLLGLDREQAMIRDLEAMVDERTDEANRQAAAARRANESKTRFLAAASHDLRQPLQAAGMFVEVLAARLDDSSPHQSVIDKLRQSIDATGTLLSTLLDVTTLESGKVKPNVTAFPLMPLLASLADQMEPEAAGRGLRLTVAETSAWVFSDRVLLERLVRNMLVNALRYTTAGGVLLGCRRRPGDRLAIQVVDTGIGIPAEKLEDIFEDFTRLEAPIPGGARGIRGPGLGLGVVRRMAQILGHTIEVRSIPGKGSVFAVVVPMAHARRVERAQS